ncbi:MAG: hypothetical protein GY898_29780 [Proteobacteria bacterium]|nr:hypothetical protein [Pseudomonadota bacterium]
MARIHIGATLVLLLLVAPVHAEDEDPGSRAASFFSGTSILLEHSGSIGHYNDLSPEASRNFSRTWLFNLGLAPSDDVALSAGLGIVQELTTSDTTFANEALLSDFAIDADVILPAPGGDDSPLSWGLGFGAALPTSKASRAASLIVELTPSAWVSLEAPLLGGLGFTYEITPTPRLHRYTTASTLAPIPCSRATGCELGTTLDQGARNTAFQLSHDLGLALTFADDLLTVSTGLQLVYGKLYKLSESPRYPESVITNPGNNGGSPTTFISAFTVDVALGLHEGVGLSVGIWTPGGLTEDGSGYYNPIGNRFTQLYLDLTITPVDGVIAEMQRAKKRQAAAE